MAAKVQAPLPVVISGTALVFILAVGLTADTSVWVPAAVVFFGNLTWWWMRSGVPADSGRAGSGTGRSRFTLSATMAILSTMLTACDKSSDPLDISSSDFMAEDASTQLDRATKWGAPGPNNPGLMEKGVGRTYKEDLLKYCPSHPGAKLNELTLNIT